MRNYEKDLEELKKYLDKESEKEKKDKNNPIFKYQDELSREKRRKIKDSRSSDNIDNNSINKHNSIVDEKSIDDVIEDINDNKNVKRAIKEEYMPHKKYNILFNISIILFPMLFTFYIISTHSTLLIKQPFNYVCLVVGIISSITFVISIILKIRHRDLEKSNKKFNKKLTITLFIISILNVLLIIFFNKIQFWMYLDPILEHKKLTLISVFIIALILFIIYIIRVLLHKRFKNNTRTLFKYLFFTYYITVIVAFIYTLYGPMHEFKEWLITTAMPTMEHQKYCKWFYSNKEIDDVMSKNYVVESGDSTDEGLIKRKVVTKYKDEYERQILEHEKGEKYKIVTLEVAGMPAYLAAIYDPTMVKVAVTQSLGSMGEYVTTMASKNDALLAINGGGFLDPGASSWGGTPTGITIVDGKVITNNEYGNATTTGGIIGFNKKGTLMLLKNTDGYQAVNKGITNAVSWGPFLIVNGVSSKVSGNGGWGLGARTAIGQRSDGVVLFLVVDSNASRTRGATMGDLTEIMERYGAVNAANLDGGTSSVMVLPKEIAISKFNAPCTDYFTKRYCAINDPIDSTGTHQTRYVATSFVVVDNEVSSGQN